MNEKLARIQSFWNSTANSPWYQSLRTRDRLSALVSDPISAFHPGVWALIQRCIPDLRGKKVLLPSSGDNHAAFAFALLGAQVTSCDISQEQLAHAQRISCDLGLDIDFICDDTTHLSLLPDDQFDLVYTSNGTHSWIDQLHLMYQNICRVLKPGGWSIMFDIHPFTRPFTCQAWEDPKIIKPYAETLPHCHWRMQDLCNAMSAAPLRIAEMAELPAVDASFWFTYDELQAQRPEALAQINDWRRNPMAALPAWLSIAAQK